MINPFTFNYHAHIDATFKPRITVAKPNQVVHITLDTDNCVNLMFTDTQMRMLRATLDEAIGDDKPIATEPLAASVAVAEDEAAQAEAIAEQVEIDNDFPF